MIDSEMGKGTLVNIYLPILDNEPVQHVASPAEDSHSGGKQERILLVDDEESLLLLTSRHLQRLGYKPTPFVNSAEALDAFVANPHSYDLVITDQTMPILKGTQLVIEMRRIRPDLPIILSSGFDESLTHDSIEELGVSSFLYKPYRQRDLAVAVREALDKRV